MQGIPFSHLPFNGDKFLEQEFLNLRDKFNIQYAIELGSFEGVTTRWLASNFPQVGTVEINPEYYKSVVMNISGLKNIVAYNGDTRKMLPIILAFLNEEKIAGKNILIFEDAHWGINPVLDELIAISASGLKPVIVMHDMKNPLHPDFGYDVYPDQNIVYEWKWIEPHIESIYGKDGYEYYHNAQTAGAMRGAVTIIPK